MDNRIELPDEFMHLIEKRDGERRGNGTSDPKIADEAAAAQQQPTSEEDRRKQDRRQSNRK